MPLVLKKFDARKALLSCALVASACSSALAADTITGKVTNGTARRPAVGDELVLLRLDLGMEEEARTKTDSLGGFALQVRFPGKLHLVRVTHQGVSYDRRAAVGDVLSIEVFDAVRKAEAVTGIAEIIRMGTKENLLRVSDMYDIHNGSSPPRTQAGAETFEFYVPARAKIESVLAAAPGTIAVLISATPIRGQPGHYTVNFPLLPGDTKFAVNYDLPYDGQATFHHKIACAVRQLAIILPPTMNFTSGPSVFHALAAGNAEFQVQAVNYVQAGQLSDFAISGTGALPSLVSKTPPPTQSESRPASRSARPASHRSDSPAPGKTATRSPHGQVSGPWLALGAALAFALIGFGGLLMWRLRIRRAVASPGTTAPLGGQGHPSPAIVDAWKNELLRLEVDKLRGTISAEGYSSTRRALEETIRRAVAKAG